MAALLLIFVLDERVKIRVLEDNRKEAEHSKQSDQNGDNDDHK